MSNKDISRKILGIQDINITDVKENEKEIEIYIYLDVSEHYCPCCNSITTKTHDYRTQRVTDIPFRAKKLTLVYRKRRYVCPNCGKRFYEKNSFLPRYYQMTNRLSAYIIDQLRNSDSFTRVSKQVGKSVSTITRVFDMVSFGKADLSKVLSIDEFKGNTNKEKYQVILTNPETHQVLDILPSRTKYELINYFKQYSKEERLQVKHFVSDMYKPYKELSQVWFKDATIITDKYHWIRQTMWAIDNVRKRIQKQFSKQYRIYFKHSKKLLLFPSSKLTDDERIQVSVMLSTSADLSTAYHLKELLYEILMANTQQEARALLLEWIEEAEESGIPEFKSATIAYRNWLPQIVNSCCQSITNGFTEGCNNKIKVLKRNAYGYRNFNRFRKRILFMFTENVKSA
jgi:transposase